MLMCHRALAYCSRSPRFVPWAAYARLRDGFYAFLLEQDALFEVLAKQPVENADQISYDSAISTMAAA